MQGHDDVCDLVEPGLPGGDASRRVCGRVRQEIGGRESDRTSEDGLVDGARFVGHAGEHTENELRVVSRLREGGRVSVGGDGQRWGLACCELLTGISNSK